MEEKEYFQTSYESENLKSYLGIYLDDSWWIKMKNMFQGGKNVYEASLISCIEIWFEFSALQLMEDNIKYYNCLQHFSANF